MKVTGVETILLNNTPPYRGGRLWLFIKLYTDEGIVGLGERPTGHTPDLTSQIALLHDLVDRFVVGLPPLRDRQRLAARRAQRGDGGAAPRRAACVEREVAPTTALTW